ncbi:MAG: prolipoprotein diacylglyceryl transferase family protein [Verrucomicrobiota bacterium]
MNTAYGWMALAGIGLSLWCWTRLARRDERLVFIYVFALICAFAGAKLVYLFAEAHTVKTRADFWTQIATGKSVLGALLGGYAGVEIAKRLIGYRRATGDWFAIVAPMGIVLGRIGCFFHGCCLGRVCDPAWYTMLDAEGKNRWPAVPMEIGFNLLFLILAAALRVRGTFPGQHFHFYLISYGLFRFGHEFMRATPATFGAFSGYQIAALAVAALGTVRFWQRRKATPAIEIVQQKRG